MGAFRELWEKCGPFLFATLVAVFVWALNVSFPSKVDICFPESADALLGASVTFGALFATLLATTLSFLSGVDTRVAVLVRKSARNNDLLRYFRAAIRAAIGFSLFSLFGYFIDVANQGWYLYIWLFFVVFTVKTFWRCADILILILWKDA